MPRLNLKRQNFASESTRADKDALKLSKSGPQIKRIRPTPHILLPYRLSIASLKIVWLNKLMSLVGVNAPLYLKTIDLLRPFYDKRLCWKFRLHQCQEANCKNWRISLTEEFERFAISPFDWQKKPKLEQDKHFEKFCSPRSRCCRYLRVIRWQPPYKQAAKMQGTYPLKRTRQLKTRGGRANR